MSFKTIIIALIGLLTTFKINAQISKAEIVATGLTCSMCSNAINKQLKSLSQVDSVAIDLNTNTFVVFLKKETNISPRALKEKVEKAGFFVGSMIITMDFDNNDVSVNSKIEKEGIALVIIETKLKVLIGDTKVKIMDKGYVTQKEFKKLSKTLSKIPSYMIGNEDDYHVKIN